MVAKNEQGTTRTGTWISLDVGILDHEVWDDALAFRLWFWLLAQAKRNRRAPGTVRFSYSKAAEGVAWTEGRKRVTPTRYQLRRCLSHLSRITSACVPEGAQRSAQGKAQGYFVITIGQWRVYQINPGDSAQGIAQDAARVAPDKRPSSARVTAPLDDLDLDLDHNHRDGRGSVLDHLGTLDSESGLREIGLIYERVRGLPPHLWCPANAAHYAPSEMMVLLGARGSSLVLGEYEEWLRENPTAHVNKFLTIQRERSKPADPNESDPYFQRHRKGATA